MHMILDQVMKTTKELAMKENRDLVYAILRISIDIKNVIDIKEVLQGY